MDSFENQLLIAMPSLDDSYFNKTVTYICEHKEHAPELSQQVLTGGPVSQDRGFVLHSTQAGWNSSLALSEDVMITTSKDILMALGTAGAPAKYMVTLGYAGWGPGQLEEEIKANSWLLTPADGDILFNTPIEQRWKKATEKLGIDMAHLSNEVGHA